MISNFEQSAATKDLDTLHYLAKYSCWELRLILRWVFHQQIT